MAQPANDACSSAGLLCSNQITEGTTIDATPGDTVCFEANASVWYTFTTNEKSGSVTVLVERDSLCSIPGTTGDGLQGVIYTAIVPDPCAVDDGFLQVSNCVSGEYSLGITSQSILPHTQYWVQIDALINDQGMPTACNFEITILGDPVEVDAGDPDEILPGESVELNGSGADPGSFTWSPASSLQNINTLNPIASPLTTTTYTLTGGIGGCTGLTDVVKITVDDNPITPPTAITPNGDGINDRWEIPGLVDFPNAIVEIFNRWGQRVFVSIGYAAEWDGTRDGNPLPEGTYYWVIQLNRDDILVAETITGYVAVIR